MRSSAPKAIFILYIDGVFLPSNGREWARRGAERSTSVATGRTVHIRGSTTQPNTRHKCLAPAAATASRPAFASAYTGRECNPQIRAPGPWPPLMVLLDSKMEDFTPLHFPRELSRIVRLSINGECIHY
jgi:hypothetical protein